METAKILKKGSIMIRATVQSMNEETLKNIARMNLPVKIFKNMASAGIETYSDIMLALPNETKKTHIDGILYLIDNDIDEFSMLQTILLKGTEMEKDDYIDRNGLKTKYRVIHECDGVYKINNDEERVTETEKIIYQTNTLSFKDYLECRKFNLLTMIFHNTRLMRPIYKYLDSKNIDRSVVLKNIYEYLSINKNPLNDLLKSFLTATKNEISEKDLFFEKNYNLDGVSSNKMYKFLTIALLNYKNEIKNLIEQQSLNYFENKKDHFIIMDIINSSFLTSFDLKQEEKVVKLNDNLSKIFMMSQIRISLTKFQKNQIECLTKQYNSKSDIESKLAYHLRPLNMIKNIEYNYLNNKISTNQLNP